MEKRCASRRKASVPGGDFSLFFSFLALFIRDIFCYTFQ
jgi:hypothetical protein